MPTVKISMKAAKREVQGVLKTVVPLAEKGDRSARRIQTQLQKALTLLQASCAAPATGGAAVMITPFTTAAGARKGTRKTAKSTRRSR